MPTRVAIYCRASRIHKHRDTLTIEQQEADCRAFATRHAWVVVEVYYDRSKSAYKDDLTKRPAFQQMLADAKARKFDIVLVYKLDRFARKVLVQYQAAAELERHKVEIKSVTETIERKTATGKMTFGMMAVMAETYSAIHGERMRSIREAEARSGRLTGPIPFGLERVRGETRPSADAPIVRRIFQARAAGIRLQLIAATLNAEGHLIEGRPFKVFDIKRILGNNAYIGMVRCGDLVLPAAFEPLIARDLWDRVRQLMAQPERRHARSHPTPSALGHLGYCANCGGRLHYKVDRRRDYRHYYCAERRNGSHCNADYCRARVIDAQLLAIVAAMGELPGEWFEQAMDRAEREATTTTKAIDRGAIEEKLRRLARAYSDGAYSDAEYERRRADLLAQLEVAPEPQPAIDLAALAAELRQLPALLAKATPEEQHAIFTTVFSHVYARPTPEAKHGAVLAVRPTHLFAPLLVKLTGSCGESRSAYPRAFHFPAVLPL